MIDCEFCREFAGDHGRFHSLYGRHVSSRILARSDRFVALPTLGQLFAGSLLILPIDHVETSASLRGDAQREMLYFLEQMIGRTRELGHPVVFEHGAASATGGGCGIYHAHVHVVPLPQATSAKALFPEHMSSAPNLEAAYGQLRGADEYLLMASDDVVLYRDLARAPGAFQSQFFRKRLVEHFRLAGSWDWRLYDTVEPAFLESLGLRAD